MGVSTGRRKATSKSVAAPPPSESGRKTALVTGASSGIGRELAVVFAEHGYDLVVVSRNERNLARLGRDVHRATGVQVTVLPYDLAQPRSRRALFAATAKRGLAIDVLVNDAGIVAQGELSGMTTAKLMGIVQLNVAALTELTSLFLQPMLERRRGHILNVASTSAFQAVPYLAVYAASKAYVLSLTEALYEELRGTGVGATALCPGFTETPMLDDIRRTHEQPGLLPSLFISDAREVAREGYEACMRGEVIRVPGLANQLLAGTAGLQPRWVMRAIASFIGRHAV